MILAHLLSEPSNRAILAFGIICSILMVGDTIIVSIVLSIKQYPNPSTSFVLFITFVALFLFGNYWFLRYTNSGYSSMTSRSFSGIKVSKWAVTIAETTICLLLIILIVEMIVLSEYHLIILSLIIYFSYVPGIASLLFLVYQFSSWVLNQRNYMILFYTLGFSSMTIALLASVIYLQTRISYADPLVSLMPINMSVNGYSNLGFSLVSLAEPIIMHQLSRLFSSGSQLRYC